MQIYDAPEDQFDAHHPKEKMTVANTVVNRYKEIIIPTGKSHANTIAKTCELIDASIQEGTPLMEIQHLSTRELETYVDKNSKPLTAWFRTTVTSCLLHLLGHDDMPPLEHFDGEKTVENFNEITQCYQFCPTTHQNPQ